MTMLQPAIVPQARYFPSRIALVAAAELLLIALLLRLSGSPAFFAAAIACSLCSIQLAVLLINRFQVNTRKIRRVARQAEFSQQAVIITDAHGRIKWINSRFTRLTGFYLSEIVGQTISMVLHGQETDNNTVEQIRRQMRDQQPFEVEVRIYNRAGESLWVASKGEPVTDARGNLTHYVITQTDLSDENRLIDELAGSGPTPERRKVSEAQPAIVLTRKLEALGAHDNREHLQLLVENLGSRLVQCVEALPAPMTPVPALPQSHDHSADRQQLEG